MNIITNPTKAFKFVAVLFAALTVSFNSFAVTIGLSAAGACQNASTSITVSLTNGGNATRIYSIQMMDATNSTVLSTLGSITTTSNSTFTGSFTIPTGTTGSYNIRAFFNSSMNDSDPFTVYALPTVSILPGSVTVASGSSIQLIAMANTSVTYLWNTSPQVSTQAISLAPASSINYTVTVTDAVTGCKSTASSAVTVVASLPIDIVSFAGKSENNNNNKLSWRTAEEKNVDFFIVERSKDGKLFQEIGKIKTGASSKEYEYMDEKAFAGTTYYRLKMPENDGSSSSYSKTISIRANTKGALKVYPTKASDNVTVELPANMDELTLNLTDLAGRVVKSVKTSSLQETIDVANLPSGMYFIVATSGADRFVERFIKQ